MKKIAIIDRYPIVRVGLEIFLTNNFSELTVLEFDSLDQFNSVHSRGNADLIIVGNTIELPSIQSRIIMDLRRKNMKTKMIIYDENPDFLKVSLYFKSGVTGYLSKQSDMDGLLKCISYVQEGKTYMSDDVMEILLPKWISTGDIYSNMDKISLTQREFEIANFLINGDTISDISKKLNRGVSTISAVKKSLFKKLGITDPVDLKFSLHKSMDHSTI